MENQVAPPAAASRPPHFMPIRSCSVLWPGPRGRDGGNTGGMSTFSLAYQGKPFVGMARVVPHLR
jgi:hypothetical protein